MSKIYRIIRSNGTNNINDILAEQVNGQGFEFENAVVIPGSIEGKVEYLFSKEVGDCVNIDTGIKTDYYFNKTLDDITELMEDERHDGETYYDGLEDAYRITFRYYDKWRKEDE